MFNIIGRYIFREITFPFFIILFVLTFVLLTGRIFQIADMIVNKGISVLSIANLIAHLLPNFLLFTLPIALLTSVLIGMGRLSTDNEMTALKASGVSLLQIFKPVALMTGITFILTFLIGFYLVPQSNFATKKFFSNWRSRMPPSASKKRHSTLTSPASFFMRIKYRKAANSWRMFWLRTVGFWESPVQYSPEKPYWLRTPKP